MDKSNLRMIFHQPLHGETIDSEQIINVCVAVDIDITEFEQGKIDFIRQLLIDDPLEVPALANGLPVFANGTMHHSGRLTLRLNRTKIYDIQIKLRLLSKLLQAADDVVAYRLVAEKHPCLLHGLQICFQLP